MIGGRIVRPSTVLTITLNPALDITYQVEQLVPDATHRVGQVHLRAGGKGVNVARVARGLGADAVVGGLVGGPTGDQIRAGLAADGLAADLVPVEGDSRRTVTVVSGADGAATTFNEPGPVISAGEWAAFRTRYAMLVAAAGTVVLSGSLPPGVPVDGYAQLIRAARDGGCRTVLDTSGAPLSAALAARPDVVKPNAAELAAATGLDDVLAGAERLRDRGADAVVASCGPAGLVALTPAGRWRVAPGRPVHGNPTGAGDACVAVLTAGLASGLGWRRALCDAVAASAAAVAAPVAGELDPDTYRRLRDEVHSTALDDATSES